MKRFARSLLIVCLSAGSLAVHNRADAAPDTDLCEAVGCSKGTQACADVTATLVDARCADGAMCCPFPQESWSVRCYESVK
jgi:hypothetical protein